MFNEATFREILPPSLDNVNYLYQHISFALPDDGRSISRNVAALNDRERCPDFIVGCLCRFRRCLVTNFYSTRYLGGTLRSGLYLTYKNIPNNAQNKILLPISISSLLEHLLAITFRNTEDKRAR